MTKAAGGPRSVRKRDKGTLDFNSWLDRIPEALISLRQKALLTEHQVAAEACQRSDLGMTAGQVRAWERGKLFPSMRSLIAFLVATESDPYDLAEALVGSDPVDSISSLSQRIATLEAQMSSLLTPELDR